MDTQPKIPTLKDSQKPQVKVRGLEAGVTLFDRLKQFKKKDLAFILAGLGTLFMAPLAEHFMMSPEGGEGQLQQGWGGKGGGKGPFDTSGANVYEPGVSGLAPGQQVGGGSDIITPLNVRDPSALVMGPGATQQPPTNSAMPSTPPPTAPVTHSDSDLKDALAGSAAHAVGAAGKMAKALLPIPKIALSGGSGLRGLGVVSGGSSAGAGGGPISSAGLVTGKAANGGGLTRVTSAPGFKNVARGQTGGDTTGMDALKKAADAAAGAFNRGGANAALNNAAEAAIPTGTGGSLGGNGAGLPSGTDKATAGDSSKDGKNVGESLAFLKQKAIQDAQIALWAKEQEQGDNKLEALKIRNSAAESIASTLATAAGQQMVCVFTGNSGTGCPSATSATSYNCTDAKTGKTIPPITGANANYQACTSNPTAKTAQGKQVYLCGGGQICACDTQNALYNNCTSGGVDTAGDKGGGPAPGSAKDLIGIQTDKSVTGLKSICDDSKTWAAGFDKNPTKFTKDVDDYVVKLQAAAKDLVSARDTMFKGATGDCNAPMLGDQTYPSGLAAATKARDVTAGTNGQGANATDAISQMIAAVPNTKALDANNIPGAKDLATAEDARQKARDSFKAALDKLNGVHIDAPPSSFDKPTNTQASIWQQTVVSAKSSLLRYQGQLADAVSDQSVLAQDQAVLDKVVKTPPDGANAPTLKDVVDQNVALKASLQKFTDAAPNAAVTPAAADDKAAVPSKDIIGTGTAIKTAQGTEKTADASVQAFVALPPDVAPATAKADAQKKAQTDLGTAQRDNTQMQGTQKGMLTGIATQIQGVTLPAAPAQ